MDILSVSIHCKTNYSTTYWFEMITVTLTWRGRYHDHEMITVCSELFGSTVWAEFSYNGHLCSKECHLVLLVHCWSAAAQGLHSGHVTGHCTGGPPGGLVEITGPTGILQVAGEPRLVNRWWSCDQQGQQESKAQCACTCSCLLMTPWPNQSTEQITIMKKGIDKDFTFHGKSDRVTRQRPVHTAIERVYDCDWKLPLLIDQLHREVCLNPPLWL